MIKHKGNTARVLDYLKNNEGISSKQAFDMFGATRLSAIIFTLREEGYLIENIRKYSKNRFGEPVWFDEYRLVGEPEE